MRQPNGYRRPMARYYLGCMHEQYGPRELLEQAVAGERAGFDGIACSDHFQPWWEPGESGHAWIWLGAAAQATERVPVGPAVTVGLKRYHPALIAQGFATLELMYPGRVFVGLGSGESLNESPLGLDWPAPRDQVAALEEACGLIRRLWNGERVDHEGRFFRTKRASLHTRPELPPPLYVSAFHPGAAARRGPLRRRALDVRRSRDRAGADRDLPCGCGGSRPCARDDRLRGRLFLGAERRGGTRGRTRLERRRP